MEQLRLAGCVIRNASGEILLLHRNTPRRQQWEIPGGALDPEEAAIKTAVREVREEIIRELGSRPFTEDADTMVYTWFLAEIIDGLPTVQEPQTHDLCAYFSLAQLSRMTPELSPNTQNFLSELWAGRVSM